MALIRKKRYVKYHLPILLDIKKKLIILGHMFCFYYRIFYFHNPGKYSFYKGQIKED